MLNLINILSEGTQNAVNDGGLVEMEVGSPGWRNPWQAIQGPDLQYFLQPLLP